MRWIYSMSPHTVSNLGEIVLFLTLDNKQQIIRYMFPFYLQIGVGYIN